MNSLSTKQDLDDFTRAYLFLIRLHVALLGLTLCSLPLPHPGFH